ncbi:MAG: cytochrome C [Caldilineae bacterium]|nr:MAG: cytochrome C [Caldilineae bacterium]
MMASPITSFSLRSGRWWGAASGRTMVVAGLLLCLVLILRPDRALAQEGADDDQQCMVCHSTPDLTMVLPSNEVLPLTVDPQVLVKSAHGTEAEEPVHCVDCHNNTTGYPHPPFAQPDFRSWQVQMSLVCGNCHEDQAVEQQDSMHSRHLAAGRIEAATCVDCHGSHDVSWANAEHPGVDRRQQVEACGRCHSVIADEYRESIHGQRLAEGNADVPACSTCHPAHQIEDPRSAEFRLKSPELCGQCHADAELMSRYDISTDVFDTYVADFHGTTVEIFESLAPNEYTNKAVCSDCHSAHRILPADDENSTVMKANLTRTCQRCHPDAEPSFSDSWMSHYRPSWEHFPLVTAVSWFYKILIPLTIGLFVAYIGLDAGRTWLDRARQRREWRRARRQRQQQKERKEP